MRWISEVMTRRYFARSGTSSLHELLDREREADVVHDRRDVVEPVRVREALRPRHVLAALLEAAVEEADVELHRRGSISPSSSTTARVTPCIAGCDGPRFTTIRFDGSGASSSLSTARARGVLLAARAAARPAPKLPGVASRVQPCQPLAVGRHVSLAPEPSRGASRASRARARGRCRGPRAPATSGCRPLQRVVLAQRVADELVVHEQPAHVGVAGEADAVHVEAVPLEPVGAAPHRR